MSVALVLVHGAWHGPSCWEKLIELLPDLDVRTVSLPSCGDDPAALGDMRADAEAVGRAVAGVDGPVMIVAHSYGGVPVTQAAAGHGNVRRVVYLTAFLLDVGDSVLSAVGGTPPPWWDTHEAEGYVDPLHPADVFYNDLSPEAAARAAAGLRHHALAAFTQPLTEAAWLTVPGTYVVCDKDAAIPVFAQEAMSRRAGRVLHLDTSHSPFLSQPTVLAALLREEAARAAEG